MHNLYLCDSNITIFDYDYYQRVCYNLLDHQSKMSMSEIMTVLHLGLKHNVKNQMIWKHFEAEIHHRLHHAIDPVFEIEKKEAN